MTASAQREAALALLAQTGIWPSNYAPPLFHLLWRLGINVPPPHFIAFAHVVIAGGAVFGVLLTFFIWPLRPMTGFEALLHGVFSGLAFGLLMACYYRYGRRKHRLPPWAALGRAEDARH